MARNFILPPLSANAAVAATSSAIAVVTIGALQAVGEMAQAAPATRSIWQIIASNVAEKVAANTFMNWANRLSPRPASPGKWLYTA